MSLWGRVERAFYYGFPRVSGDEPAGKNLIQGFIKFSPRERG